MERLTRRPSGRTDFALSWIWKNIYTATALGLSNSTSTCRKTSSESAFFNELMSRKNIGNSALPMLRRERSGAATSAFEQCLSATNKSEAPWYVVPADDKENARLIVSQIILYTLNGLEMTYPEVSAERRKELQSIRERLIKGDLD